MTKRALLRAVKGAIQELDPQAEVWLFGSRARGDARPDSDWDFLVLTDKPVDRAFKYTVWDKLFYVGLDTEQVITAIVKNRTDWKNLAITDLHQNIKQEGKRL